MLLFARIGLLSGPLVVLLAGCHCARMRVETRFPGLKKELEVARTNGGMLRLLIVHGISTHTQGYSSNFVESIAKRLRLTAGEKHVETFSNKFAEINGYLCRADYANQAGK